MAENALESVEKRIGEKYEMKKPIAKHSAEKKEEYKWPESYEELKNVAQAFKEQVAYWEMYYMEMRKSRDQIKMEYQQFVADNQFKLDVKETHRELSQYLKYNNIPGKLELGMNVVSKFISLLEHKPVPLDDTLVD
jgi:hypothetical protein